MIRKIIKEENNYYLDVNSNHIFDIKRIKEVFFKNGYEADLEDCAKIWDEYSELSCASWINLPEKDKELWEILKYKL